MDKQLIVHGSGKSLESVIAGGFLPVFVPVTKAIGAMCTAGVYISGKENIQSLQSPALWLPKHESWLDFVTFPYLWEEFGRPVIKGVSRSHYFGKNPLSFLASQLMKLLFIEVERVGLEEGLTAEQAERMRERNERQLERIRRNYEQGIHIALAPEGTTKSNGRISPIKSGAYNVSHIAHGDRLDIVPCVPVGNTYDFLSANRPLVFLRIGRPFYYEPAPRKEEESDQEYKEKDIALFAERIRLDLLNLNTITAAQIGCFYILNSVEQDLSPNLSWSVFKRAVEAVVGGLHDFDSSLDPALLKEESRTKRIEKLYHRLRRDGYIIHTQRIDVQRVLQEPTYLAAYKKQNILRYTANRLREMAEVRFDVAEVLRFNIL